MINKRLLVVPQLLVALFLSPLCLTGARAQESDSGQAEEGTTTERKPGITVIVDAVGAVQIIDKPGAAPRPANKGDQIPVEGTVVTGADGRANLALSNGDFYQVLENSCFSISRFEQFPYECVFSNGAAIQKKQVAFSDFDEAVMNTLDATEKSWNKLPSEPTKSVASFALNYGTIIAESKKLKSGSAKQITTPVGSAGIRGTIWRLTVQPTGGTGSNQFRSSLDVSEGRVDFGTNDGSRSIQVQGGYSMNAQATVPQGGVVNFNEIGTNKLSPERVKLLDSTIEQVGQEQDAFTAVNGNPDVFIDTLGAMKNVDVNSSQSTADAILTLMGGGADDVQQVTNVVSALVITRAEPASAPKVISEIVSSLVTQSPNLAPSITGGVVATSTMAAKNETAPLDLAQKVTHGAITTAITSINDLFANGFGERNCPRDFSHAPYAPNTYRAMGENFFALAASNRHGPDHGWISSRRLTQSRSPSATATTRAAAITTYAITIAATRGSEKAASAIAGTVVGAAINAMPSQAKLLAATAINSAANADARPSIAQSVVSSVASSALTNAAYAAIASGADRQAAEKAAAEVAATIRETAVNSKFGDAVAAVTAPQAIQQATTQAQNSYDRGETPNTNGSTGGGDLGTTGDASSSPKVDTPKPSQPISQPPPPPPPTPAPTPTPSPTLTPTPTPSPTPIPSNG